jgi:hypothetical protein
MAVTANQLIKRQEGMKQSVPVLTAIHIFQGTMVFVTAAGFATDVDALGANKFVGIAIGEADNTGGASGDIEVEVWEQGEFELVGSGFVQDDVGSVIYASDNFTITLTADGNTVIGVATRFVSSTVLVVRINPLALAKPLTYAVTNWTTDRAMDCNAAADAEICDVLGTLIGDLIAAGILNGTVAA